MKHRRLDDDQQRNNNYIPIDLTAEILSRLPIKSIGRFISVSKSWRDVITGHRFSSLHAKNKPFSTFYNITARSLYYSNPEHHAFEVDEDGNSTTTTFRPRIDDELTVGFEFVGSCNGLLCLLERRSGFDAITLMNPITNERTSITLPKYRYCPRGLRMADCRWVGEFHKFGYSPSTDEYKVFKYVMFQYRRIKLQGAFAILTIGVDRRWRELSPLLFSDELLRRGDGVYCDGALHWFVDRDDPNSNYILAFDIARESTRRMPIRQAIEWHTRLSVFENRPDISSVPVPSKGFEEEVFEPLHCVTKNGGMLLVGVKYGHTWLYCPEQERLTDIGVVHVLGGWLFEFTPTFSSIEEILYGKSSKQCTLNSVEL